MNLRSAILSHLPTLRVILLCGPVGLLWSYCCLSFAGYLKSVRGFSTGYTRKIFHVLIFLAAVAVQTLWGFAAVCLFGSMVSLVVAIVSLTALFMAIAISPDIHLNARSAITLPVIAMACTVIEAVSPHGWDNTPMQIVPTLLAAVLLSS